MFDKESLAAFKNGKPVNDKELNHLTKEYSILIETLSNFDDYKLVRQDAQRDLDVLNRFAYHRKMGK